MGEKQRQHGESVEGVVEAAVEVLFFFGLFVNAHEVAQTETDALRDPGLLSLLEERC